MRHDALFEAAVDTGTSIEIDGALANLDLDWALARRAIAAGAMLVINSSYHRAEPLNVQMELGVTTACRQWVERRRVVNARSLADIRAVIAAKRQD